jgi:hypothetical protein
MDSTILAIEPGKFNSVFCRIDPGSRAGHDSGHTGFGGYRWAA